jgi:hypothetical protein
MPTDMLIADFIVSTPNERDHQLEGALAAAESRTSIDRKLGVLVTRHNFHRFSVRLTAAVSYGTIKEHDYAHR